MVHCASGWRSSVGASLLRSLGHQQVTDLLGGHGDWVIAMESASA
ncbi:MAG: rhodanese-like domain-containing protein [Aeromicrobium sp.]